ncbi:MAG: gluconokinase [Terriglobales bacterium]
MIVIVMGVTGSGKTTVGTLLAEQLGWKFADADSFHSAANVEKMRRGIALDDADRAPWLAAMHAAMGQWSAENQNAVLACSALKGSYRGTLATGLDVKFVYLKGSYEVIYQRLISRHGHFATEKILRSQFQTLEEPNDAIVVDVSQPPERIVSEIRRNLNLA